MELFKELSDQQQEETTGGTKFTQLVSDVLSPAQIDLIEFYCIRGNIRDREACERTATNYAKQVYRNHEAAIKAIESKLNR